MTTEKTWCASCWHMRTGHASGLCAPCRKLHAQRFAQESRKIVDNAIALIDALAPELEKTR